METMQASGLPASDIIVMATRNGARAMRRERDLGTLETGKLADLLILGEDPRANVRAFRSVQHVMRGGKLYRQADLAVRPR
jgi:imidazolonepropionase-like amidohydrolase